MYVNFVAHWMLDIIGLSVNEPHTSVIFYYFYEYT